MTDLIEARTVFEVGALVYRTVIERIRNRCHILDVECAYDTSGFWTKSVRLTLRSNSEEDINAVFDEIREMAKITDLSSKTLIGASS